MELAPNPHYSGGIAKALGGSFKLVTLAPKTVRGMTQLPKETQKKGAQTSLSSQSLGKYW